MKQLTITPLISSSMVIQQGIPVPVSGKSAPGAEITVTFKGKAYRTSADSGGAWRILLDSHDPGGPYAMEIACAHGPVNETEKITLSDIYAGDVWICSGQSNMELPMERLRDNYPEEWQPPVNSLVRQFKVPQETEFSGPRQELSGGCWTAASVDTLHEFSGTAWFFAQALFEKRRTPIGLVNASWGGTPAEAWMSREALENFPEKITQGNQYADPAFRDSVVRASEAAVQAWDNSLLAADAGAGAWYKPETNVSQWEAICLPGNFAEAGLAGFCGIIWLRREFEAAEEFTRGESSLWLGTIVDADTVYVNGVEVGSTTYRYPPRKYRIPAGLLNAGTNQIVIRVICNNGEGGITRDKDFRFFRGDNRIELEGTWKYRVGARASTRPGEFFLHRQPMCLYNAMIAPILGFPCKGILWYQGESNEGSPHEYAALFAALINDWRRQALRLQQKPRLQEQPTALPFLFVQLPIFGEPEDNDESNSWAILREAQRSALSLPATGMAAGLELGEWNDIHPLNKKGIGYRLALAAGQTVYHARNTAPGPLVRGIEWRGNTLAIAFNNCGEGLIAEGTPYVTVAAEEGTFRLPAVIEGPDSIMVDVPAGPRTILYAWASNPRDRQLYNAEGLPVIPFRLEIKGGIK